MCSNLNLSGRASTGEPCARDRCKHGSEGARWKRSSNATSPTGYPTSQMPTLPTQTVYALGTELD